MRLNLSLGLTLLIAATTLAQDYPADAPLRDETSVVHSRDFTMTDNSSSGLQNEYPPGHIPVPRSSTQAPLRAQYMISPSPQVFLHLGYQGFGNKNGYSNGAGLGVVLFMDGGASGTDQNMPGLIGIVANVDLATSDKKGFGYVEAGAKWAGARYPVDREENIWWGYGADISGRASNDARIQGYMNIQPQAFIGTMKRLKNDCVIHVFSKVGVAVYDSQTQSPLPAPKDALGDTVGKPSVGAKALAACQNVHIVMEYDLWYNIKRNAVTHKGSAGASVTLPVGWRHLQLGGFAKFQIWSLSGSQDYPTGDPRRTRDTTIIPFIGIEGRY